MKIKEAQETTNFFPDDSAQSGIKVRIVNFFIKRSTFLRCRIFEISLKFRILFPGSYCEDIGQNTPGTIVTKTIMK